MVGGCSLWGFGASTITPHHHSDLAMPNFPKIHPHQYRRNSVRVHPYAHPQHLKVLKHFLYIQYGCEMQSMGICSLNHDLTTSYRLGHNPFPLKFTPTSTMY